MRGAEGPPRGFVTQRHEIHVGARGFGEGIPLLLQCEKQPFHAGGKAHGRHGLLAAHLEREQIVAAAPRERALCPQASPFEFEGRPGVVVEPPHQEGIFHVRDV